MSIELERLPASEMERRIECCRTLMRRFAPEAGGMLVCSRISIYYLTGTLGVGLVWVPMEGEPVLMVRKGLERARKESPLRTVFAFRSYRGCDCVVRRSRFSADVRACRGQKQF